MGVCCNSPLPGRKGVMRKWGILNNSWSILNMPLPPFAELFFATRQSVHTAILDGNRSIKYLLIIWCPKHPFEPFTTDNYFEQYDIPTVFVVKGQKIIVASKRLADTLARLPEQRRAVLLMYFFLGYTDTEVGNEYGRSRSTANYWKHTALKQLRKEWLKKEHEEQEADTLWNHWKSCRRRSGRHRRGIAALCRT